MAIVIRPGDVRNSVVKTELNMRPRGSIDTTLAVRGSRYGEFDEQARVTQNIKAAMRDSVNWDKLPPIMREALEMDASKTARILNGDPDYDDSWHDKAGYATLVENFLHKIFKKA